MAKLLVPSAAWTARECLCQQGLCVFGPVVMKTLHKELPDLTVPRSSTPALIYTAAPSPRTGRPAKQPAKLGLWFPSTTFFWDPDGVWGPGHQAVPQGEKAARKQLGCPLQQGSATSITQRARNYKKCHISGGVALADGVWDRNKLRDKLVASETPLAAWCAPHFPAHRFMMPPSSQEPCSSLSALSASALPPALSAEHILLPLSFPPQFALLS